MSTEGLIVFIIHASPISLSGTFVCLVWGLGFGLV